jgi:crotonobetainyl-CoA:carnitine CoA-transferase CaiB-like acyl-CoA transferase
MHKVTDPNRGPIELVATPVKLSRTPAAISFTLHAKGADNLELLQSLGYSEDDIKKLQEKKVI